MVVIGWSSCNLHKFSRVKQSLFHVILAMGLTLVPMPQLSLLHNSPVVCSVNVFLQVYTVNPTARIKEGPVAEPKQLHLPKLSSQLSCSVVAVIRPSFLGPF